MADSCKPTKLKVKYTEAFLVEKEKKKCEGGIINIINQERLANKHFTVLTKSTNDLKKLGERASKSKDQKESIDIGNAIQATLGTMNAEKIKMDIETQKMLVAKEMREQEERNEMKRRLNTPFVIHN